MRILKYRELIFSKLKNLKLKLMLILINILIVKVLRLQFQTTRMDVFNKPCKYGHYFYFDEQHTISQFLDCIDIPQLFVTFGEEAKFFFEIAADDKWNLYHSRELKVDLRMDKSEIEKDLLEQFETHTTGVEEEPHV